MDQTLIQLQAAHRPAALSKAEAAPWGYALLSGLPHLLYPLAVYSHNFIPGEGYRTRNGYLIFPLELAFWGMILLGLAIAWRGRWPRWSATWIGYGLVGAVELMVVMPTTGSNDRLAVFSAMSWLALTLIVLVLVARRDWVDGLLAVLPLMPMWYSYLALDGVIGDDAPVFYAAGFVMAAAVAWIVRSGCPLTAVVLILAAITLIGLPIAYASEYYPNFSPPSGLPPAPGPGGVARGYFTYLIGYAFLAIPVLLTTLIRWRRRA